MNIILSTLRKKRRFRCAVVCKTWYILITGKPFKMKLPQPSDLVIQRYTRRTGPLYFPTIKYLTVSLGTKNPALPEISQPPLHFLEANDIHAHGIRISQSCNGLFLCPADITNNYLSPHAKNNAHVKHYVYNPTTNKTRLIPLPSLDYYKRHVTAMNLAFDPSNSPHYKIVSLSTINETFFSYTQVDIYSSETWSWKVSKAFPKNCSHVDFSRGVFLNGSIHWPSYTEDSSYYFHVENECFKLMPMPPVQDQRSRRSIRFFDESGGWLLLIDFHEPFPTKFDVFGMENDYSGWSVKYRVDFSLRTWFIEKFHVMSVICGGDDEDDSLLVIYVPGRDKAGKGLLTYNLSNTKLKKSDIKEELIFQV
ncbi:hypothetical protein DH2020_041390 [Rehmannia glutinosa]|uniref:F-box protein n=1 Tax=Rehmannia glutinosa TaxID=99300 RepID=A0ABR0US82_REHGL